ncbi:MAG: hypothetical protein AAGG69_01275 [Pseudomonadota bacterium]
MTWRVIKTEQQLCFRALCGMNAEAKLAQKANNALRASIIRVAMASMWNVNEKKSVCDDCPYRDLCGDPSEAYLLDTRAKSDA